jgi:hypothetical protein
MRSRMIVTGSVLLVLLMIMLLMPRSIVSVPSFARQTELNCSNCHTVFPELNSFGRLFKLNSYTLASEEAIEAKGANDKSTLRLPKIPPLSAMIQTSITSIKTAQKGTQNSNTSFPQQFSFFFAGEITPNLGAFAQVTWDDASSAFDFDALDVRYSNHTSIGEHDLIYGLTLNNNPTVQDIWNSTPAWGFPYASSAVAPTPGAVPIIAGTESLEQHYAGLGVYALYDNLVYAEFSAYRSTPRGESPNPPDSTSKNITRRVAPYWRLALQHQWPTQYLMVGTYGFSGQFFPVGISGTTNQFTDIGVDAQSMTTLGSGVLTAHTTYIHEKQDLDASFAAEAAQNHSNNLSMFRIDANYFFKQRYGVALGYFTTSGSSDTLLYAPARTSGFSAGKPNSDGFLVELSFLPWLNTKLSLQYVVYNKFNGAKTNYDGFGRNASDNNTAYLLAWLAM